MPYITLSIAREDGKSTSIVLPHREGGELWSAVAQAMSCLEKKLPFTKVVIPLPRGQVRVAMVEVPE
jgi:hypothetical protein